MGTAIGFGAYLLLLGYLAASELTSDLDNKTLASLVDPFAMETLAQMTRYWTPVEQNTLQLMPNGLVLANRAIWIGVGLAILGLTTWRYRMSLDGGRARKPK